MKKRISNKFVIILFSAMILFLTVIAYARLSDIDLFINGTASVTGIKSETDFKVAFTDIESVYPEQPNDITVVPDIDDVDNKIASFTVSGLKGYGDYAIIKYEVTNNSDYHSANLSTSTTNDNSEYFTIEESFVSATGQDVTKLNPGESAFLVIKVNVIKVSTTTQEANVKVILTASSEPYSGE